MSLLGFLGGRAERPAPKPAAVAAPKPAAPPRSVGARREFRGLLWFPVLTVSDGDKLVVSARAGLPHCPHCLRPLALAADGSERWACAACGRVSPACDADFFAMEAVVAACARDFLAKHPDFRPGPALPASARA